MPRSIPFKDALDKWLKEDPELETIYRKMESDEEHLNEEFEPKSINIRESLNNIDKDTFCEYDLYNLYESFNYSDEQKKHIVEMLYKDAKPSALYEYMTEAMGCPHKVKLTEDIDEEEEETEEESDDYKEYVEKFGDTITYGEEEVETKVIDAKKIEDGVYQIKIENPLYVAEESDEYKYIWIDSPYNEQEEEIQVGPPSEVEDEEEVEEVSDEDLEGVYL